MDLASWLLVVFAAGGLLLIVVLAIVTGRSGDALRAIPLLPWQVLGPLPPCGTTIDCKILIQANLSHTGKAYWRRIGVDACLARLVTELNHAGALTASCCCGHGRGPGSIVLQDGTEIVLPPCRRAESGTGTGT